DVTAARCTMPVRSGVTARSRAAGSVMSPTTVGTSGDGNACRSSTPTQAPASRNAGTTDRPMNPEPPVTRIRSPASVRTRTSDIGVRPVSAGGVRRHTQPRSVVSGATVRRDARRKLIGPGVARPYERHGSVAGDAVDPVGDVVDPRGGLLEVVRAVRPVALHP